MKNAQLPEKEKPMSPEPSTAARVDVPLRSEETGGHGSPIEIAGGAGVVRAWPRIGEEQ